MNDSDKLKVDRLLQELNDQAQKWATWEQSEHAMYNEGQQQCAEELREIILEFKDDR